MNNETFGISFQFAICSHFQLDNDIELTRVNHNLVSEFLESDVIAEIFRNRSKPVEYLARSNQFTSQYVTRCPHNFLLENEETFSVRTFKGKNKMFAPKVVGQAGDETFNHFFGDLYPEPISRENFKEFCLSKINEILPIVVDYALVSDYNCWFYLEDAGYQHKVLLREDLPELTYELSDFSFTKLSPDVWNESNTVKYRGKTVLELQLHTNRPGYKIRLHRENFPDLLESRRVINNSTIGDSAELAICRVFSLDPGNDNDRLVNNSDRGTIDAFIAHYNENKQRLFPLDPVRYADTEKRARGSHSKSGVDFYLEGDKTLSVKTNKSKSYKVCPPEIGQPSPATFDLYFAEKGWYSGNIDEQKFRELVRNPLTASTLLIEYVKYLNECDYILWSLFLDGSELQSYTISKAELEGISFDPALISYSNDFLEKSSVTLKYGRGRVISIGEFQVHSARNSLKFRFNFDNLLSLRL